MDKSKKVADLKIKLVEYEKKLAWEMKGYRGVIHESAASEIKHTKVMVYKAMVQSLREELEKMKQNK